MSEDPVGPASSAEELFDPEKPDEKQISDRPIRSGDAKQLRKKAITDKQVGLQEENDLRAILGTPEGVRFVTRLLGACGWNLPHFHPDPGFMAEIAGRRSIALQLENWISDADLGLWFAVRSELETKRKPKKA